MFAAVVATTSDHNLLWISGVVGVFLPHLIAIVNQTHWSAGLKSIISTVACLAAGTIVCWATEQLDFSNLVASAGIVFTFTVTTYKGLWKPTGIIDAVETSTTPARPPA
jgi:hypothetical protein